MPFAQVKLSMLSLLLNNTYRVHLPDRFFEKDTTLKLVVTQYFPYSKSFCYICKSHAEVSSIATISGRVLPAWNIAPPALDYFYKN